MAEDDDEFENEAADDKIDSTLLKLAEQYVGYEKRAKELNKAKAEVRDQAEQIGIPSLAFQHGVRMVKLMDKSERRDYQAGLRRVVKVLSGREGDLFPDDVERRQKRAEKKKAEARSSAELDEASAKNPRSNPDSGGAKPRTPSPEQAAAEQAEGDAILADGLTTSQSAQAQAKRAAAGLN